MSEPLDKNIVTEQIEAIKRNLRYEERYKLPCPFMVEFSGPPSVGKTSTIAETDDFLRPLGLNKVWPPQEGPREIRHILRTTPDYNLRTAMYSLTKLLDESHDSRYDLILFDRCAFDAYCWMEYWAKKDKLSPKNKAVFQSFFMDNRFIDKIDICYFMVCDPKVSMKREFKNAISNEVRETTNYKSMETLDHIWRDAFAKLKPSYPKILRLIDTTTLSVSEMTKIVVGDMLETLSRKEKTR